MEVRGSAALSPLEVWAGRGDVNVMIVVMRDRHAGCCAAREGFCVIFVFIILLFTFSLVFTCSLYFVIGFSIFHIVVFVWHLRRCCLSSFFIIC